MVQALTKQPGSLFLNIFTLKKKSEEIVKSTWAPL
jgi:hypothetical protein